MLLMSNIKKKRALIIMSLSIGVIVLSLYSNYSLHYSEGLVSLRRAHEALEIGMSTQEVSQRLSELKLKGVYIRKPITISNGCGYLTAEVPYIAFDLYLVFSEGKLCLVALRSIDTMDSKPLFGPEDKSAVNAPSLSDVCSL